MSSVRGCLLAGLMLALAACGNDTSQPDATSEFVQRLSAMVKREEPETPPTRAQLRAAITPEFREQTGNKPLLLVSSLRVPVSSILTMFSQNGNVRTYLTPDQISFAMRDGVLIATRGLGGDLMSTDVTGVLDRIRAGSGRAERVHRYLDSENQDVLRRFTCDYARVAGGEVTESCRGAEHSFTNRYTLSGGRITVSTQWVGPGLESYLIEDIR